MAKPRSILDPARHAWCRHPVQSAGLLVDADDYYREFYRVASRARRSLLLSGWQFDSDVELLRGPEAEAATRPTALLKFLNHLCDERPELHVYILAWDFHVVFALEREWVQKLVFHWTTHERLRFHFDSNHAPRGSHHQKFVVADGEVSFLGGLDLCDHRWDDRKHHDPNPLRISRGEPHKPFHDVQAYLTGREVAGSLTELFTARWARAGGDPITVPPADAGDPSFPAYRPESALDVPAAEVALSRTDPHGAPTGREDCDEILALHRAAIAGAERLVYVETQYFSSHAIAEGLEARLRDASRPRLEVVLVLNKEAETPKEQVAVGLAQAQVIGRLREVAAETGHRLGVYFTLPACDGDAEPERATYIHSKLMIVDDRFLTVGSANLTNRSMGVDTELNASFETADPASGLGRAIRAIRGALLGEHLGGPDVDRAEGLVAFLDAAAASPGHGAGCRLRPHPSPTEREREALRVIDPQQLPFDPDAVEDDDERSVFVGGIGALWRRLFSDRDDTK